MFQEPKNYTDSDHFFFQADKELEVVCNAPKNKDGVFKVIELRDRKVTLVFIGYSNSSGLYGEIVHGLHHDKNPRKLGWTYQLLKDKANALDIYWYATDPSDNPKKAQTEMLRDYLEQMGQLPEWNK